MMNALRRSAVRGGAKGKLAVGDPDKGAFKVESHRVMICNNGLDNTPESFATGSGASDTVFLISQSRSPGHKDQGQDCVATARLGEWEVYVLCDGHDRDGHLVARAVCGLLPVVVLRQLAESGSQGIADGVLEKAFEETSGEIAWTSEGVRTGMFVKVFGGQWDGKVGYVGDSKDAGSSVVIIVDADGYHRPVIDNAQLRRAKFTGGSTCVCLVRNLSTNQCRAAFTGDSRILMLRKKMFEDPIVRPVYGLLTYGADGKPKAPPLGMTTPAHNVFNKEELLRLNTHHAGAFEIDGAFLVNPVTKFAIQPTRGFGDFDMFGTGYTNDPEVSAVFTVEEGAMVFCASDGVFDDHVWKDDELVTFFDMQLRELDGKPSAGKASAIAAALYKENLERSLAGGYVDDISLYCFLAGKPTAKPPVVSTAAASPPKSDAPPLAPAVEARLSKGSSHSAASGDSGGSPRSDAPGGRTSSASSAAAASASSSAPPARPVGASKSLPHGPAAAAAAVGSSSAPRKSLLGGLWKGKPAGRAASKSLEIDEGLLVAKPAIDKPSPEDRRHTIQRKEKASFTEVSNMLKDAMARQHNKQEPQPDSREMAEAILSRYASQHGLKQQDAAVETSHEVHREAAKEALRQSKPRPGPSAKR
jgi:serine/threonine protein phosphatase PrpC